MLRFFWKATPESADHQGVKCKVLKDVKFGETLDTFDYCSDRVKAILKVPRDKKAAEEEEQAMKKLKGENGDAVDVEMKDAASPGEGGEEGKGKGEGSDAKGEDTEEMDEEMKAALALSMEEDEKSKVKAGPGLPKDFMGIYELYGVVCHKGRDSSSGHYTAWVRLKPGSEDWFIFDDDEVSECKTADVLKLTGGGDWHMSYINFYRAKE